jgi:anti-sigma factor RsiW
MDCSLTLGNLIGYHFATASDDERQQVEAHLVQCTTCLRSYLALKAHVDRGGAGEADQPSEGARLRLRAAVQQRFRQTHRRRMQGLLTRPVPLYQGLAVAAVIALFAAFGPAIARVVSPAPEAHVAERVDTARRSPESLTLY